MNTQIPSHYKVTSTTETRKRSRSNADSLMQEKRAYDAAREREEEERYSNSGSSDCGSAVDDLLATIDRYIATQGSSDEHTYAYPATRKRSNSVGTMFVDVDDEGGMLISYRDQPDEFFAVETDSERSSLYQIQTPTQYHQRHQPQTQYQHQDYTQYRSHNNPYTTSGPHPHNPRQTPHFTNLPPQYYYTSSPQPLPRPLRRFDTQKPLPKIPVPYPAPAFHTLEPPAQRRRRERARVQRQRVQKRRQEHNVIMRAVARVVRRLCGSRQYKI